MSDDVQYPTGFCLRDLVSWGTTSLVVLDNAFDIVIKAPLRSRQPRSVYERFAQRGGHAGLLVYHGVFESGIRLEYAPRQNLRLHAAQVAEAIRSVHDSRVIHGDLTCADFAGSSIDDSPLLVLITESHEFPGPILSVRTDLFALSSVLYEIMTGHPLYEGLIDAEIPSLYLNGQFPQIASLGAAGIIIEKCWKDDYSEAGEVVEALQVINPIGFGGTLRLKKYGAVSVPSC
ncbi:hypothetical protein B0T26DRAFT_789088 [Lasiosphaeria miniovina]|uniref:Protein kinase domain-containing protein n=1 Tax=Lasiosphaeria miniovina TaxID=1954250 RepID=A0AA39ZZ33_9PEZI|nr:uncharacterized protein B0T26DRAFT_789088 [Lasiosphaeria miniovina]KAK0706283.1 hypothetical protein B0T26DRAFT_789088 [Lasiosphaeria miniovina]